MEWLKALPGLVFWWMWIMVAILAAGSLYATWWARRNAKALAAQRPCDVSALAEGYRLGWGRTTAPALTAPLTGRACVWWKAEVWESVRESDASGKYRHVWRQIADEESDRPILFGDKGRIAAVWTYGATMASSSWSDWKGQQLPPEDRSPPLHSTGAPLRVSPRDLQGTFGPRFRYVEKIIPMDSPFFALGEVTRVDPALYVLDEPDEPAAGATELNIAREDDDHGWRPEPSRLGVCPASDKSIAEDMAQATWSISAPQKAPFLLSVEHPEAVSAEQELGAKGGLIMGGIFIALAIFLLWGRIGG